MPDRTQRRQAGVLIPLFSAPSRDSWGIGEIADLPRFARWMQAAGLSFVQVLPLNEMAEGQNSPYSALSAMAIDPIFISPSSLEDLATLGGASVVPPADRDALEAARRCQGVQYAATIRAIKQRAFALAFDRFLRDEWEPGTARGARLRAFIRDEAWWLDEYTMFRAIHAAERGRHWREWPASLRDRDPSALDEARRTHERERLFFAYLQWIAAEQWAAARKACGVEVFGDFPFMVSGDSADVWSRQQDFRVDASVGAPPDAFSETGQDWGFPAYRWPEIAAAGDQWLKARARRNATLYDGYRVDHLVGFFRTYVREPDGSAGFVPSNEPDQIAQGERLLALFTGAGSRVIAEDLGVIPDFVRKTLASFDVPGFKVLRWEREWDTPGQPYRDPAAYPAVSVATSGTHDTDTLADWWDQAGQDERAALCRLDSVARAGCRPDLPFGPVVRDAILTTLYQSSSDLVLLPIQDIFGWRDRINTPALISDANWTWRLPWEVDALGGEAESRERADFLRRLARETHRLVNP